jgi:hypothetical protein
VQKLNQPPANNGIVPVTVIIEEATDEIAETGLPRDSISAALDALAVWQMRPDAASWHSIAWAEGRRGEAIKPMAAGQPTFRHRPRRRPMSQV